MYRSPSAQKIPTTNRPRRTRRHLLRTRHRTLGQQEPRSPRRRSRRPPRLRFRQRPPSRRAHPPRPRPHRAVRQFSRRPPLNQQHRLEAARPLEGSSLSSPRYSARSAPSFGSVLAAAMINQSWQRQSEQTLNHSTFEGCGTLCVQNPSNAAGFPVVETGVDPVTLRFSGVCSAD